MHYVERQTLRHILLAFPSRRCQHIIILYFNSKSIDGGSQFDRSAIQTTANSCNLLLEQTLMIHLDICFSHLPNFMRCDQVYHGLS